ncbi:MAG: monoamine oxidase, partial [Thermomicrobiales bacterium]|nr:monoamine oxidase [Thermomicrobiales bacterium]
MGLRLSDINAWAQGGFPGRTQAPKRVIVVGAGMAGLVAALELQAAGHDPIVLEAQGRVGGRVLTLREPFSDGLYAEAGAMRIPRSHSLTLAYVQRFGLRTFDFTMGNPRGYYFLHGQRHRVGDVDVNPALLDFPFADHERGQTYGQLWGSALAPLLKRLQEDPEAGWSEIVATHDHYSTREFLEANNWSEGAIELFGLLADQEALMNSSFLELLREEAGGYYTDMVQIEGGMDLLPRAFLPELRSRIRFGAKMVALDQSPDGVTVHYQTAGGRFSLTGDYAILTVPFPGLRHMEMLKPFSRGKQRAIRQLHYDASAKVFIQCRSRFWEEE